MSLKAVIYGPAAGDNAILAETRSTVVSDLNERGYTTVVDHTEDDAVRNVYKNVISADALVLLPGWETLTSTVVVGQMALTMGIPVWTYPSAGEAAVAVDYSDVTAPLIPGAGVVAPDSDLTEHPHEEAARIVLGPRGAYYDTPLKNLGRAGLMWSGILQSKLRAGQIVTAEDVALCMVGLKLAREAFRHKRDNITDAHGYLMTLDMIREERAAGDANENAE